VVIEIALQVHHVDIKPPENVSDKLMLRRLLRHAREMTGLGGYRRYVRRCQPTSGRDRMANYDLHRSPASHHLLKLTLAGTFPA
jgi:hypothetical protein